MGIGGPQDRVIMPNVASTESGGSVMSTLHHNISSLLRAVTILPEATRSSMRLAITCRLNGNILDSRLFIYYSSVLSQAYCLDNTNLDDSPGQYCIHGTDLLSCWYLSRYCGDYLRPWMLCVDLDVVCTHYVWIVLEGKSCLRACSARLSHVATSFQPQ